MDDHDMKKFHYNMGLLSEYFSQNIDAFNALPESVQDEIVQERFKREQEIQKRFQPFDREKITTKFCCDYLRSHPGSTSAESEAEVFIRMIETWGGYAYKLKKAEREAQERRKEKAESFAKAFSRALEAMRSLDDAALGYLISAGVEHIESSRANVLPPELRGNAFGWLVVADELKTLGSEYLQTFIEGLNAAVSSLPQVSRDSCRPEFETAAAIEDYLGRLRIPFSTTETGLAGIVFHAVMAMAEIDRNKAGYWLVKARDAPNSWTNFVERLKRNAPS